MDFTNIVHAIWEFQRYKVTILSVQTAGNQITILLTRDYSTKLVCRLTFQPDYSILVNGEICHTPKQVNELIIASLRLD